MGFGVALWEVWKREVIAAGPSVGGRSPCSFLLHPGPPRPPLAEGSRILSQCSEMGGTASRACKRKDGEAMREKAKAHGRPIWLCRVGQIFGSIRLPDAGLHDNTVLTWNPIAGTGPLFYSAECRRSCFCWYVFNTGIVSLGLGAFCRQGCPDRT